MASRPIIEECRTESAEIAPSRTETLLAVDRLVVEFRKARSLADLLTGRAAPSIRAVDGVSLDIGRRETLGLVGESGSGKTTLARAILGLYRPAAGRILFRGRDLATLDREVRRALPRQMQMVFQDPYSSLNPRLTIGNAIAEVLAIHRVVPESGVDAEVARLLQVVGLSPEMAGRRPRALSGGQRQRVGLARALAVRPAFIALDEPVAALDVSIQAQILNLLKDLRDELGLAMLLVAHELQVVKHMSDRIAVMYLGEIVEIGRTREIFDGARHPYTQGLLKAVPRLRPEKRRRDPVLQGDVPSPLEIPSGCRFRTRCPMAQSICAERAPPEVELSGTHRARCHFAAP